MGESSFATAASKLNVSPAHKQAYIRIFVKAAQLKNNLLVYTLL